MNYVTLAAAQKIVLKARREIWAESNQDVLNPAWRKLCRVCDILGAQADRAFDEMMSEYEEK